MDKRLCGYKRVKGRSHTVEKRNKRLLMPFLANHGLCRFLRVTHINMYETWLLDVARRVPCLEASS